jgi:curved DNA-binding protein CbpA
MRISEAYSTLSSAEKRTKYDRDVLGLHRVHHHHQHAGNRRGGSYSSTTMNPAGGRPATGLSRRRGTFTGPPPSFYRSGGWGDHGAKRSAAHEDSTGGASSKTGTKDHHNDGAWATAGGGGLGGAGGMGPGQDPFGHRESVPHFDKEGHERTGRKAAERRMRRMRSDGREIDMDSERGQGGMFFVIGGVLVFSCLAPLAVSRLWMAGGQEKRDWDQKAKG